MEVKKIENPDLIISVFVNEEKEIEDYELIENFVVGEFGNHISCNAEYYDNYMLENAGVLTLCEDIDSLYHIYLKMHWADEDVELEVLHILKVKDNYSEYLNKENDYLKQIELSSKDEEVTFEYNHFNNLYGIESSGLNYHEFKKIIKTVSQKDIYLAHRMAYNDELIKELGDSYNAEIMLVEKRKLSFRRFLKRNPNIRIRYDEGGYHITNKHYRLTDKVTIYISYENIDNLEDEIMQLTNKEILDYFFNHYAILKVFEDD